MIDLKEYISLERLWIGNLCGVLATTCLLTGMDWLFMGFGISFTILTFPGIVPYASDYIKQQRQMHQVKEAAAWLFDYCAEMVRGDQYGFLYPTHNYMVYNTGYVTIGRSVRQFGTGEYSFKIYDGTEQVATYSGQWRQFNAGPWIDDLLDAYRMERSKAKRAEKAKFAPLPEEKRKREEDISVYDWYDGLSDEGKAELERRAKVIAEVGKAASFSVEDLTYSNAVIHEHSDDVSYVRYGRPPDGRMGKK